MLAIDYVTGPYEHLFWKVLIVPLGLVVALALWQGAKSRFNWVDVLGILIPFGLGVTVLTLVGVNIYASYLPNEKALAAMEAQQKADAEKTAEEDRLAKEKAAKEEEEKRKKEKFESELANFKRGEGKDIQSAIDELVVLQDGLTTRIKNLQDNLEAAGRVPEEDENLTKLKSEQAKLDTSLEALGKSLEDAFFEYQAFKTATTSGENKTFDEELKKGQNHAKEVIASFQDLKQQISESEEK